jgi:hypothetical protein
VRELLTIGLCLIAGLLLIPGAIYFVGLKLLGPYDRGGYFNLVGNIASAVIQGAWPFCLLVLGPYIGLWVLRFWRLALRSSRQAGQ